MAKTNNRKETELVLNMGPQHPSTHGVLRLILELNGEVVQKLRLGIGYLHTGIEKNFESHSWQQGVTDATRIDYVSNISHEVAYCLGVETLLGFQDGSKLEVPKRARDIRVLFLELSRIASHLIAIGTAGNELGGTTLMTNSFREREYILKFFEACSGLRMNNAFIRIGGISNDVNGSDLKDLENSLPKIEKGIKDLGKLLMGNVIFKARCKGVGYLNLEKCIELGVTGPVIRSAGFPLDLRKDNPYCGYENYDFSVITADSCDAWGRFLVRMDEMQESLKIVKQAIENLKESQGEPVFVNDPHIAWPAKLTIGSDGQGNSEEYVKELGYGQEKNALSMEALIKHFKLVTKGFSVPKGQVFQTVECARGLLGAYIVSDGKNKPYRVHFREPSFTNLQAIPAMCEGGYLSDVVVVCGSVDPVMGSVDR